MYIYIHYVIHYMENIICYTLYVHDVNILHITYYTPCIQNLLYVDDMSEYM